ncbi:L-seryl-tRNA(Sec) selenium transferase [Bacillus suaedaesalsae]|uniref:L-seryl-tRNA(Sec) selenium transferase n=1 Tax=Bacillus suaedaesalsae TaxID=2810349 RepID=A0ABS2DIS2_9BACI|nr:L-seryl-tRNA(Sec) selenium transferase [Bacillus suaedaesalsae]MBM6618312.1 L-seryl-tRNA(Sec) selenium transferase [Bacillus suaedaesalsae]
MKQFLRYLPPIHELQKHERFADIQNSLKLDQEKLTLLTQQSLNKIREQLLAGTFEKSEPTKIDFITYIFDELEKDANEYGQCFLKKVINATGTILHTNLGRARLSKEAIEHVVRIATHYSNLEYKIEQGERGSRHDIIEKVIKEVTGAEAAMVVNNNAAAVYLILRALAKDKEVIVSRGQLVEIGGSFRISSIMEESGANLIEVGTTNKTHLFDYENAISEETKMLMKVHTSNFKTIGFTKSVSTEDLIELAQKHSDIIYYEDLGSGALYDFRKHGIGDETVVDEVIKQGADIVSFSGDKLLGGPQAGIIAGKKKYIDKLKKHQLARVLRVDKLTFAALEATLVAYLKGKHKMQDIPVIRDLLVEPMVIKERAERFGSKLTGGQFKVEVREAFSQVGGGTLPDVELPTFVAEVSHERKNAETLSRELRLYSTSIITRVKYDKVLFDFRTLQDEEIEVILQALVDLA